MTNKETNKRLEDLERSARKSKAYLDRLLDLVATLKLAHQAAHALFIETENCNGLLINDAALTHTVFTPKLSIITDLKNNLGKEAAEMGEMYFALRQRVESLRSEK